MKKSTLAVQCLVAANKRTTPAFKYAARTKFTQGLKCLVVVTELITLQYKYVVTEQYTPESRCLVAGTKHMIIGVTDAAVVISSLEFTAETLNPRMSLFWVHEFLLFGKKKQHIVLF